MLTRQPHTRPLARPGVGTVLHPTRKLICRAKGKKGQQKNEGVYFEYRDVEQPAVPERKEKPGEFSWVQNARGSVRQYDKGKQTPKRSNKGPKPQQHQQEQPQQPQQEHEPVDIPQQAPTAAADAGAAAQQEVVSPGAAAAAAPAAARVTSESGVGRPLFNSTRSTSDNAVESSSDSSNKDSILTSRKQQLLQRMKGAAAAAGAATAATGAASTTNNPPPPAAAAAAAPPPAAAAAAEASAAEAKLLAAAAAAASSPQLRPFELDDETDALLQELLDMASELAKSPEGFGFSNLADSDPMADPLAALDPDGTGAAEEGSGVRAVGSAGQQQQQGLSNSGSSNGSSNGSNGVSEVDAAEQAMSAFGAELAAAKAAMQRFQADLDSSSSSSSSSSADPQQQQQQGDDQVIRAADLLAWEADQARQLAAKLTLGGRQVYSMESALLAVQQDELRDEAGSEADEDDMVDDLDDTIFGDYDINDDRDESSAALDDGDASPYDWLGEDPELLRLLEGNDAEFARLLNQADEGEDVDSSSGSQQEAWAGMGVEDWLQADDASSSSSGSSGGGLAEVMDAINADASLDDVGRVDAKMRIAGMFNKDQGAAAAAAAAAAAKRRSQGPKSADADGSSSVPELLPRPVRPKPAQQ